LGELQELEGARVSEKKKLSLDEMEGLIDQLPDHERDKFLQQFADYRSAVERENCQKSFMAFVKKMWPGFIHGRHHAVVAKAFEQIASGEIKRLAISMPPRHTKSEFGSYMLPAWFLGKFPGKKVMQASNTGELAVGFGRKVRNLVMSEQYHEVFPDTRIRQDSKSAGRWAVNEHSTTKLMSGTPLARVSDFSRVARSSSSQRGGVRPISLAVF
jgi:hypothetical protein